MIKIIKKETYEEMKERNATLTKQILRQQNELKTKTDNLTEITNKLKITTDALNEFANENMHLELLISDKDKEIKRLKTLCTKNKVDYKAKVKEGKKVCKNKKNKQLEEK